MKSIFIIDEHASSKLNGVGTFIGTIQLCMKRLNMQLNLISFNEEVNNFCIEHREDCTVYCIPPYGNTTFLENAYPAIALLCLYIKDNADNIFFVSHTPSHKFLKVLKLLFPKSKRIVAIHDQGWTAPLLGNSYKLKEIMSLKKIKGKEAELYKYVRQYTRWERSMYRLSHHVICLCQSTFDILIEVYHVPKDKISLIPNGIDVNQFDSSAAKDRVLLRQELGIYPDEIVLLFSGRAVKAKGIFNLLEAFETLWQKFPKLRLVIAGVTMPLQEYITHVPHSISHVTFTGLISRERLNDWYKAADVGVLPSYTEQCSYTGLEMMAAKLPVITTDGNGVHDMFNSDCASIVKADDETMSINLTDALWHFLRISNKERKKIVDAAYSKVVNKYSVEHMQAGYSKMLEKLFNT